MLAALNVEGDFAFGTVSLVVEVEGECIDFASGKAGLDGEPVIGKSVRKGRFAKTLQQTIGCE
jgi:hypothetical protein